MQKNLNGKIALIIAILVVFLYGIFGIPHGGLKESITRRIHLGLDLRGGTHIVLQVKTAEAVAASSDNDMVRAQDAASKVAPGAHATKPDPKQPVIVISGVSQTNMSAVRDALSATEFSAYDLASTADGYKLTMKLAEVKDLRERTLETSIETIRSRVDSLGVAEPVIQKYGLGEDQILVELPGIDNADHVRDVIQSTARLEIHEVTGGPFTTEQDAQMQLQPDSVLVQGGNALGDQSWWSLKRIAIVQGPDFRDARASQDEAGRPDVSFTLTTGAGDRFYAYTSTNIGKQMAIV
ncbi:MAG TPA: protein translocase subunit SecD, partial [Terriglobus sp.]